MHITSQLKAYLLSAGLFFLFFIPQFNTLYGQGGLAAYIDYRNRFYIFDHGVKKKLEGQPVKSFKVGGNHIAYIDYADNFKVYTKGEVHKLEIGRVEEYFVSDYLVAYTMVNMLKVYESGKSRTICTSVGDFNMGDSLIVFFDTYYSTVNGYYDGTIFSKQVRRVSNELKYLTAKRNIGAVLATEDRSFYVFYRGQATLVNELVDNVSFNLGRDIMAFIDRPSQSFKAFYKGEMYDIENFQPASFDVGDGLVAYVDNVGNFKVFTEGRIATISSTKPTFYEVKDSMIVYNEVGRLRCFMNNSITEVVPYIPQKYEFGRNQILFIDNNRNVALFRDGITKVIYNGGGGNINSLKLERDVVVLNVDVNHNIIIYKGQVYH